MIDTQEQQTQHGLDRAMRAVLARLELVSNGTTASPNPGTGGQTSVTRPGQGHPEGAPAGGSSAPHLYWRREYDRQTSNGGRSQTIKDAEDELGVITGRYTRPRPAGESPEQMIARMLTETEGWTPTEVAQSAWRMSEQLVRRYRKRDGRHPDTGKATALTIQTNTNPVVAARMLKEQGCSTREIAEKLNLHQTQVVRYLRRAA